MNTANPGSHAQQLADATVMTPSPDDIAGDILLDRPGFQIRVARGRFIAESELLVDRRYAWRGYKLAGPLGSAGSDEITLQACQGNRVFGTLTLRVGGDRGLAADALFQEELDAYRATGRRIGELTRLAIDPELGSKEVLAALFHMAYVYFGPGSGVDDVFIEVHPRHAGFYRRMLGFKPVAGGLCRHSPRVDAPALLLHVEVAHVGDQAASHGARGADNPRSLYPHFCSQQEEARSVERLAALAPDCSSPVTDGWSTQPQYFEGSARGAAAAPALL
jgi:hypothetical protein